MQEKLYFYYTNDLHSNFDQWPRVAGYLKEKRTERAFHGNACWLVDVGDHVDRVHPITEAYKGKANVKLLNDAGYDFVTIGNNEGITLAHDDLFHLYDEAEFQIVCANLHSIDKVEPTWLNRYKTFQSPSGVRLAVIGLTAPFNDFYELLGWHISSPYQALEKQLQYMRETADIIILLSHLGINEDQEIARRFPEIDVIIGGHTHHLLRTGEYVNNTVITAAGKHCANVGEVILTWDHETNKLMDKQASTTDVTQLAKDTTTVQALQLYNQEADVMLRRTVACLPYSLEANWFKSTEIMQRLTDTLLEWTDADCAMLNAGLLLDQLPAGNVTYKDIHRICPHPINPCVVTVTGKELTEIVRVARTREFMETKLKGFGFRGEVIGKMIFSGLEMETTMLVTGEEVIKQLRLHGETLDDQCTYQLATADAFTFGRLLPKVAKAKSKSFFLPEFMRDLLVQTVQKYYNEKDC